MPTARITVTGVWDQGDDVIVWGRPQHEADGEPIGFVFQAKGTRSGAALAEQASRLARETEVVISYAAVAEGWNLANGLSTS